MQLSAVLIFLPTDRKKHNISEVIRCSRLALRSDLGSCEIKKKIDALSEGQNAIFTLCLFTQETNKSCSLYVYQ